MVLTGFKMGVLSHPRGVHLFCTTFTTCSLCFGESSLRGSYEPRKGESTKMYKNHYGLNPERVTINPKNNVHRIQRRVPLTAKVPPLDNSVVYDARIGFQCNLSPNQLHHSKH